MGHFADHMGRGRQTSGQNNIVPFMLGPCLTRQLLGLMELDDDGDDDGVDDGDDVVLMMVMMMLMMMMTCSARILSVTDKSRFISPKHQCTHSEFRILVYQVAYFRICIRQR